MDVLWDAGEPMSAREVLGELADRELAYTTVMTVLDRLWQKDFVHRSKGGRAWRYRASASREQYVSQLMLDALALTGDRAGALSHFARAVSAPEAYTLSRALREKSGRTRRAGGKS